MNNRLRQSLEGTFHLATLISDETSPPVILPIHSLIRPVHVTRASTRYPQEAKRDRRIPPRPRYSVIPTLSTTWFQGSTDTESNRFPPWQLADTAHPLPTRTDLDRFRARGSRPAGDHLGKVIWPTADLALCWRTRRSRPCATPAKLIQSFAAELRRPAFPGGGQAEVHIFGGHRDRLRHPLPCDRIGKRT